METPELNFNITAVKIMSSERKLQQEWTTVEYMPYTPKRVKFITYSIKRCEKYKAIKHIIRTRRVVY